MTELIPLELEMSLVMDLGFNSNQRVHISEYGTSERIGYTGILYQQAFDFLLEKFDLLTYVMPSRHFTHYIVVVFISDIIDQLEKEYDDYRVARLEGLKVLIEIAKTIKSP